MDAYVNRRDIIVKNTVFLYIRMLIVLIINLFIVRIILDAFGEIEYGVYNVVAGVISMLSFLTTVVMTSTQRFYSIALGEKDETKLKKIFSLTIKSCGYVSITIIVIAETLGLFLLNKTLNIPDELHYSANILYQTTILSFVIAFFQVPFGACIIAHEEIGIFAIISTSETILKLCSALFLLQIYANRLILYGILLAITSLITLLLYIYISKKKFSECTYSKIQDHTLFRELIGFSGWNSLGSIASIGIHYVNTIIINVFFGPVINAVFAIAFQVSSALNTFSGSVITALRPPMIKLYAEKNFLKLNELFFLSNKGVFYCMLILCLPIMIETRTILQYWLNFSNEQTIIFVRLIVVYTLILVLNNPISIIIQASGYVKQYFLPVESITLLCPILTFVYFKLGFQSEYVIYSMILCVSLSHIVRIIVLMRYYDRAIIKPYCIFLFKAFAISVISAALCFYISSYFISNVTRLIAVIVTSIFSTIILCYSIALTKQERGYLYSILRQYLIK